MRSSNYYYTSLIIFLTKIRQPLQIRISPTLPYTFPFPLPLTILPQLDSPETPHIKRRTKEMGLSRVNRVAVTIPNGTTTSNVLQAWNTYGGSAGIIIYSPATLPETVRIQVSPNNVDWFDLQDGSPLADVTVPSGGKAIFYDRLVLSAAFRLVAGANVGGTRTFFVSFQAIYS